MFAARVITDRISGYSRGFGFVKYATVEEAGEGIKGMDGKVSASINRGNSTWIRIRVCGVRFVPVSLN
jgi:RNA recognition motif-containing protein